VLLTVIGIFLVKLFPFGKERGKLFYHRVLSRFTHSILYIMANVKKTVINPQNEDLSKPAVIICNHQSFLDILSVVMLNPKVILLTNKWVWNSPVFGAVVRMADYFPVADGVADHVERLGDRVRQGYSIVVFPEGTRSADGTIHRFHKGAFYLAEKLQIDILPLLIHGTGYAMGKGDFRLKSGSITLKFLPRISPAETGYGSSYAERTKKIARYFRAEFDALRKETETPAYYKEQWLFNYIYKGPVLEWYARIKVRQEKYYQEFHDLLPKEGQLLDLGCGYGFMAYMLNYAAPGRHILGVDYDKDKIRVAEHCSSRPRQIHFEHSNALTFSFGRYDGIIVSDMLHYVQPAEQKIILDRCIESLVPGGTLVIRDGDSELIERHKKTQLTEFFSTRIFKFNKSEETGLSFLNKSFIRSIAEAHGLSYRKIDSDGLTSNVIFVLRKEPLPA
jgi:1-acyl-sn-glycerol-3-phosphate acyltransferase